MKLKIRVATLAACLSLTSLAFGQEAMSFDSDGVELRYFVAGAGEPVIMLHGFSGSAQTAWINSGNFQALADAGFRVIAVDQRGHGGSGKPHRPDAYGIEMVDDVGRLLNHLDIERAHIVGYSMGAKIANTFRSRYPWRIRTLTLGGYGWPWSRPAVPFEEARESMANRELPDGSDREALAAYRTTAHLHVPSRESLAANSVPTLSVVGTEDTAMSRDDVETLRQTMARVTAVDLPGTHAGPDGLLYKPAFAAAVIDFIRTADVR